MSAPMLEVSGLRKAFGSLIVTDDVDLSLAPGERAAVIGPNGAGKTTLFNLLAGELRPDAGVIRLDGHAVTRLSPDRRARAGLARSFQKNNLFAQMTVLESLATAILVAERRMRVFWRSFGGDRALRDRAVEVAELVGLADALDTTVRHLSYGTQRQLEIGLALVGRPKVLLLDEPTSGMSPEETGAMKTLIAGLPADLTILLVEHDMDVVFDLARSITVLDYGQVVAVGSPEEIRRSSVVREIYLGSGAA
jgi:branched-chain amino acid transport system ATP-binding protein